MNAIESLNTVTNSPGKYDEYQSICRENLFDTPAFLSTQVKQKRIDDLKEKVNNSKNSVVEKTQLLKEYIDQGKTSEAEQQYASIKSDKSPDQFGKIAEALYAFSKNELNRAQSILATAAIENPKNREILKYLGEIYFKNKKYFEATSVYFDLVKLTKESFDLQLCETYTLDSQYKDAEKFCKKADQSLDKNPFPLIYLGISKREQLKYDEAIQYFKDSLKKNQTEMGFSCLGEVYYIKENYFAASEFFKKAFKAAPTSSRALLGIAWSQLKDKKILESLENFKQACQLNRNVNAEIRKAYKILNEEKSPQARLFLDHAIKCTN